MPASYCEVFIYIPLKMAMKVNRKLLPVKAHFFFFFAALGPILPQLNVYGRQLGVSAEAMGFVTAGLPLFWAVAKPAFGYIVDYWPNHRKLVFMLLITTMTGSYCGLWFIPASDIPVTTEVTEHDTLLEYVYYMNDTVYLRKYHPKEAEFVEKLQCRWSCSTGKHFEIYLTNSTYINTIYIEHVDNSSCSVMKMEFDSERDGEMTCSPKKDCNLLCFEDESLINSVFLNETKSADNLTLNTTKRDVNVLNIENNVDDRNDKSNTKDVDAIEGSNYKLEGTKRNDSQNFEENSSMTILNPPPNKYVTSVEQNSDRPVTLAIDVTVLKGLSADTTAKSDITKMNTIGTEDDQIKSLDIATKALNTKDIRAKVSKVIHTTYEDGDTGSFYMTGAFWSFVSLMCVGTVAFNVANCIGDAVCFDVLGPDNGSAYGAQRAWGTAGYGVTALLGGWLVDARSRGGRKDFTPAFLLALGATAVDLISCRRLKLPALTSPKDSGKALREVLRIPRVLVFIIFAVVAGLFDSFIIYYMFWFLEDLAEQTGHQDQIKLIEGVIVAGQSFVGEIMFFALSGSIIKRWGFGVTMTLSLFCYGVRMALISLIQNPWQLVPLESIMQGPTYALCYSTIVGYAATVAPEGYSATVQGIVAGMDDGLGFALGSLVGGQLFGWAGGRGAFRILATGAGAAALLHAMLFAMVARTKQQPPPSEPPEEGVKMLPLTNADNAAIYRDTVVPLTEKSNR